MKSYTIFGAVCILLFGLFGERLLAAAHANSTVYYFAYGSNMYAGRLAERDVHAVNMGAAALPNYSMNYSKKSLDRTGKCNIEPASGGMVYGVLFEVPVEDLRNIDKAEGALLNPPHYVRKNVTVMWMGQEIQALTYVAQPHVIAAGGFLAPSAEYAGFVVEGARQNDLPANYIAHLRQAGNHRVNAYRLN